MGRCVSLETRIKKMTIENAELQSHLVAAQDAQRQLTTEVRLSVCHILNNTNALGYMTVSH